MKKIYKVIVALVLALSLVCVFALAACGNKDDETKDNPSGGTSYTVTIVISDSDTQTQTVEAGGTATKPDDPTSSDGSIFSGWYTEAALENIFDWTAEITADTTVYAGWITVPEGYSAVTFNANYDGGGVLAVETVETGDKILSTPSASRTGYRFMGWNTAADGTGTSFAYGSYVNESMTVYAIWYKGYVMEAEYTDLTDANGDYRVFYGYSNNYTGTGAILEDSACSNGKYVQAGSTAGSYMIFEIKSEAAVDDAYLTITASIDYGYSIAENNTHDGDTIGTVSISSSQYQITVFSENDLADDEDPSEYEGTPLQYSALSFNVSSLTTINTHCAFTTYTIGNISLAQGTNYIKLYTSGEAAETSAGGQIKAKCPNLDCITVYSSDASSLTQQKYQT